MAHLKTMAKRRFGSSHSTAVNRKAPMKMIAEAYITASTAVIGGDAYQWRDKTYRTVRPMLQIKTAPAAAMGVAMVQSGRDRVAVITTMNTAHIADKSDHQE
jgi:hypothetical protein